MALISGDFPGGSEIKASACSAGNMGSIPGSGRFPGDGNGNPLQYSCLENPMDGGAWRAAVHRSQRDRHDWVTSLSLTNFTGRFQRKISSVPKYSSFHYSLQFVVVQSLTCVWIFVIPLTVAHQASLSSTISWSLLRFMFIESMIVSNCLIFCHPLLLLPSTFCSISLFQWVGSLHQMAKLLELQYQSFLWIIRVYFLNDWLVWFPFSPRDC